MATCECGCGGALPVQERGRPRLYLHGHDHDSSDKTRARWKDEGRCIRCGKELARTGKTMGERCAARQRAEYQARAFRRGALKFQRELHRLHGKVQPGPIVCTVCHESGHHAVQHDFPARFCECGCAPARQLPVGSSSCKKLHPDCVLERARRRVTR